MNRRLITSALPYVNNIPQLTLCIIGYSYESVFTFYSHIFMTLAIVESFYYFCHNY